MADTPYLGSLIGSLVALGVGVLIYVLAVAGVLFAKPTAFNDLGLYAVTVVLVGFGAGGLWLRRVKIRDDEAAQAQF